MRALVLFAALPLIAVALVPNKSATPIEKFQGYRTWFAITPQPVDMMPALALSCVGPGPANRAPNPHVGTLFKVYVNGPGKKAMQSKGKLPFPVGSMIVKEKFEAPASKDFRPRTLPKDAKPTLLTAMVKREKGFDAANGDWEYVVLNGDATKKETQGLKHCAACHLGQKKTDFVFGNYGGIGHGWDWTDRKISLGKK